MHYKLKFDIREDGALFTLVQKKVLGNLKIVDPTHWDLNRFEMLASALSVLQRSLDEVDVDCCNSNEEPVLAPAAHLAGEGVLLSHLRVASLSEGVALRLGLPPVTPLALSLRSQDIISSPDFRLESSWIEPSGATALGVMRKGAFVRHEGRWQRLPKSLFALAKAVEDFHSTNPSDEDERKRWIAIISKSLPEEERGVLNQDGYLRSLRVQHAASFSLRLLTDDGQFQVEPVLFARRMKSEWQSSYTVSEADAIFDKNTSSDEFPLSENQALLPPEQQERFAKVLLDRYPDARPTYVLGNNEYIHIEPLLRNALKVVKEVRSADAEIRKDFARRPQAFLKECLGSKFEESRIEDVFIVTQEYSDRIVGLGIWKPIALPWIKKDPNSWHPESFGLQVGSEYITFKTADEIDDAIRSIGVGMSKGNQIVDIQGVQVPTDKSTVKALEELKTFLPKKPETVGVAQKTEPTTEETRIFIEVDENFEQTSYSLYQGHIRANTLPFREPHRLGTPLKSHQTEALKWMQDLWREGFTGCLLADDMGLGKTLSTLAFLAWIREARRELDLPTMPILVVAPTSLMGNWKEEVHRHLKEPRLGSISELHGPNIRNWRLEERTGTDVKLGTSCLDTNRMRSADVILTTYETLRDYHHSFASIPFSVAVYDEIQKAKNPTSQISRAVKVVNAQFRIGLTGTPIENSLTDLWAIIDILLPGYLGDLKTFSTEFDASDILKLKNLKDRLEGRGDKSIPAMLRRMKSDALRGLPRKIEHVEEASMPPLQAKAYADAVSGRSVGSAGDALKYLHSLRMISLHPEHPSRWQEVGDAYIGWSARLESVMRILDEIKQKQEKVLVFLESLEMQDVLALKIRDRYQLSSMPFIINGAVQGAKRHDYVRRFQEQENCFDVMILSPKAGGVGLTLTAANHVIHFSRWWNPAVEDQCTDRIYRIGQVKEANVYYPLALHPHPSLREHSFDRVLHLLLKRKRDLSREALVPTVDGNEADFLLKGSTPSSGGP